MGELAGDSVEMRGYSGNNSRKRQFSPVMLRCPRCLIPTRVKIKRCDICDSEMVELKERVNE